MSKANNNRINVIKKADNLAKVANKKYFKSKGIYIFLSLASIFISATTIVLNLYSIRYNTFPQETMIYFVVISFISVAITTLIAIQSLLSVSNKIAKMKQNLQKNIDTLEALSETHNLTKEQVDDLMNFL